MNKTISAQQLRNNLGEFLDRAFYKREVFTVTRAGREKAVLLSPSQYRELVGDTGHGDGKSEHQEEATSTKQVRTKTR